MACPRSRSCTYSSNDAVSSTVFSEDYVMPTFFLKKAEAVTMEVYLQILKTVVKLSMETVVYERSYVTQENGRPTHTSQSSVELAFR